VADWRSSRDVAQPPDSRRPDPRPGRGALLKVGRLGLALLAVTAVWVGLALHPQPLFAYSMRRSNLVLYARDPFPPPTAPLLEEVLRRVSRSPLYDATRIHRVFLCDRVALFTLLTLWDHNAGGVTQIYFDGNVFIRPSSIVRDTVTGPSGKEATGERTLAYFLAHEITHAMTADRIGRWRYHRLAAFQQEGYADYVAFNHRVDLARGRTALARAAPEMDPRRSGLYARHALLVAYLLDQRRLTVYQLLARPLDPSAVEAELRQQLPDLPTPSPTPTRD
jgi:hypothetical protein